MSLTSGQQRRLAELVSLSFSSQHEDDEDTVFRCTLESVMAIDRRFTRTAPKKFRENICQEDMMTSSVTWVREIMASTERQLDDVTSEIGDACGRMSAEETKEVQKRILTAFGRVCLKGRSSDLVAERGWLYRLILRRNASVFVALCVGSALSLWSVYTLRRRRGYDKDVPHQKHPKRCACPMCSGRFRLTKMIGEGAFGTVHRCTDEDDGDTCVVKMIKVDIENDVNELQEALDEAKHLISLSHTHVVAYNDVFVHRVLSRRVVSSRKMGSFQDYVCIVMEYCSEGTLLDTVELGAMRFSCLVDFVRQIGSALAYLHRAGVVHCDVKLENVFITVDPSNTSRLLLKLGDFGLATHLRHRPELQRLLPGDTIENNAKQSRDGSSANGVVRDAPTKGSSGSREISVATLQRHPRVSRRRGRNSRPGYAYYVAGGTVMYQPPETFEKGERLKSTLSNGKLGISAAVDVWAFGCALWEAATGLEVAQDPPYLGELALMSDATWNRKRREMMKTFSSSLDDMMRDELEEEERRKVEQLKTSERASENVTHRDSNPFGVLARARIVSDAMETNARRALFADAKHVLIKCLHQMLEANPRRRPRLREALKQECFDESTFFFRPSSASDPSESDEEDGDRVSEVPEEKEEGKSNSPSEG